MALMHACIERPVGTTLVALGAMVAGALAFASLPVAPLPRIDMPMLMVQASLPGASPEVMASSVATPLERRLGRIAGLDELTSTSTLGSTQLALQFSLERDIEGAARDAQAAISAAAGELPSAMPAQPVVRKLNPADAPILILSMTSSAHAVGQLYEVANSVVGPKLAQVPGVGQVSVAGGQQPAVRIQADPLALAHRGLTLEDVRVAVGRATAASPLGRIFAADRTLTLSAHDQMFAAAPYRALPLRQGPEGTVRLGDVACVTDGVESDRVAAWVDGRRAITLMVRREPNANIIDTIATVRARLPELRRSIPADIELDIALDRSATIAASVHDVERTLLITVLLVVLVVWLFLLDVRVTLIPALAVPCSLLGTFVAMAAMGFSLNNLSLMALTISIGFVVDDAIVVTENIVRLLQQGGSSRDAARAGAQQVAFTVVSMTASLLAVFVPLLFMQGMVGRLFAEFAWTLALAVGISAVVSLTLTPMMCAQLLRPPTPAADDAQLGAWGLRRGIERMHAASLALYARLLQRAVRHSAAMAALTLAAVGLSAALFVGSPKGLFPQQDTGMIMGMTEGPQDIAFAAMQARQARIGTLVGADPDVEHVINVLGGGGPGGGSGNTGALFIGLRTGVGAASAEAVIRRLRGPLAAEAGISTFLQPVQDVRMGGRGTRSAYQYSVQSSSVAELRQHAPRVLQALRALPQLRDVATDDQLGGLELRVALERDRAAALGITPAAIDDVLYDALGQRQIATLWAPNNAYHVVLEVPPAARTEPASLQQLYLRAPGTLGLVPMGQLIRQRVVPTSLSINHEGQLAATTLSFNLAPGVALGEAVAAIGSAERRLTLPESVRTGFAGTAQAYAASSSSQPWLILLATLIVYVVLGVLYESALHPITILSTLPSAGVGALVALALCRIEVDLIAFVGIILLIGIVKKNAIMMVDVALERQRTLGEAPAQAIVAAAQLRFRPIMMTTLAALLGALPLALGQGTGSALRRPLGIAIIGGLLLSQALTLVTTPAIYLLLERARARVLGPRR